MFLFVFVHGGEGSHVTITHDALDGLRHSLSVSDYQSNWPHDVVEYSPALLRLNPNNQMLDLCYHVNFDFLSDPFSEKSSNGLGIIIK